MSANLEYEYSFRVKDAEWYKQKCELMNFSNVNVISMDRSVFKNGSGTIARLTIKELNGTKTYILDFKQDTADDQLIKEAKESSEIKFRENNVDDVKLLLKNLNYKKTIRLSKKRTTYNFDKIKVEIDEYVSPEKAVVVEIEGDKIAAEDMYNSLYNEGLIFEIR